MIPQSWENRDFYKDLGVPKHANHQQIKHAYRTLVKKLHPDLNSGSNRHSQFLSATEAFNVLSNPEKRALYDSYTSGPESIFDPPPMLAPLKKKDTPKLLGRTLLFISLVLLVRNLNFPATPGLSDSNLNQTLVLIAGPQRAPGSSVLSNGSAVISLGSCDSSVNLTLQTTYTSGDFMMRGILLRHLSFSCTGNMLTIILQVKSSGSSVTKYGTATTYKLGDVIVCSTTLSLSVGEDNSVSLNSTHCVNQNTLGARANFQLSDLSARDVKDGAGALALQISG